jgi:hypothetical protein
VFASGVSGHVDGARYDQSMQALRTDFTGYEGMYVAIDARTGEIVIADTDPRVVLEAAKGRDHVSVRGRVPLPDEPDYIGFG